MKKRIGAFLLSLLMLVMTFSAAITDVVPVKADDLVLKLHYHRADGDYNSWDVWLWEAGGDGSAFTFDEVDEKGNGVATKVISGGCSEVGFIVRTKGAWDKKDVEKDQFIDVSAVTSGTIHYYVESGVEGGELVLGDDVKAGIKVISCAYKRATNSIEVVTSSEVADYENAFTVMCGDEKLAVKSIFSKAKKCTITLEESLNMMKKHTIIFDGTEYVVDIPNAYNTDEFEKEYTYDGDDLGATWTKDATTFKVWAPTASAVKVNLYENGDATSERGFIKSVDMEQDKNGTWVTTIKGDKNGVYYTYSVTVNGVEKEACDPYAHAVGVNGDRAMVIDLESTNPEGWDEDKNPNADLKVTDSIIYELQIRDLGSDPSANISLPGKYLSLTEHGTTTVSGIKTGIDHIKELGITHLHILPMYDFGSIDENKGGYNWGYDPKNYNVPEGSYATDAKNGEVRVKEVKQMVQSLHNDGISVVMDVVYNHVYEKDNFCFNQIVPGYFSRENSSGSGCGNDTASERSMVKKFIVDSVLYWATEYHIDGFRFDLVGLIDTETINAIMTEVHAVRPDVIFYGEGWSMTTNVGKEGYELTTQPNSTKVPGFAFFDDGIRDALKGSVFNINDKGLISGTLGKKGTVVHSWLGAASWCKSPSQQVNYVSCHDNDTLFDRLTNNNGAEGMENLVKRNKLAASIYMTAQGIPFMQAGEEMLRSKVNADGKFNTNSYNAGDAVNSLKWNTLDDEMYYSTFEYYKGLIAFRKAHAGLRLATAEEVQQYVTPIEGVDSNMIAYMISGDATDETSDGIIVLINPTEEALSVTLPEGKWGVCVNAERAGVDAVDVVSDSISVEGLSATVLVLNQAVASASSTILGMAKPVFFGVLAAVLVVVIGTIVAVVLVVKKKKKSK